MKKRKILSVVLAFALAFTLLPFNALTAMADGETGNLTLSKSEPALVSGTDNQWDITLSVSGQDTTASQDIVLVFDTSKSMKSTINAAREAAKTFVDNILQKSDKVKISVVIFDEGADEWIHLSNSAKKIKNELDYLTPSYMGGGSNIQAGLKLARNILSASTADNKSIILLSDGEPTYYYNQYYENVTKSTVTKISGGYKYVNSTDMLWFDYDPTYYSDNYYYTSESDFLNNRNRVDCVRSDSTIYKYYPILGDGENVTNSTKDATAAEAQKAINAGISLYAVGTNSSVSFLERCQNRGYYNSSSLADLRSDFASVLQRVFNVAINATVTDIIANQFTLLGIVGNDGNVMGVPPQGVVVSGNTVTWDVGNVPAAATALTYRIAINTGNVAAGNLYDTSASAASVSYTDLSNTPQTEYFNQVQAPVGVVTLKFTGTIINADGTIGTSFSLVSDVKLCMADINAFDAEGYSYPAAINGYNYVDYSPASVDAYNRTVTYNYERVLAGSTVTVYFREEGGSDLAESQEFIINTESLDNVISVIIPDTLSDSEGKVYGYSNITVGGNEYGDLDSMNAGEAINAGNNEIVVEYTPVLKRVTVKHDYPEGISDVYDYNDEGVQQGSEITVAPNDQGGAYEVTGVTLNGGSYTLPSDGKIIVNEDTVIVIAYAAKMFTVTFYDEDGTTKLGESTVAYGGNATEPATPTKTGDAQYSYSFDKWVTEQGGTEEAVLTNVTGTKTVYASYTQTTNQYTVTFYDEDGTTKLGESTVAYGGTAIAPATPTKTGDAQYSYTFDKWVTAKGGTEEAVLTNITGTKAVYASYTRTENQYTVTFYDEDGTYLNEASVGSGGNAQYPGEEPTKPSDGTNNYTFDKWVTEQGGTEEAVLTNITGNMSVYASYTAEEIIPEPDDVQLTVQHHYYDADGNLIGEYFEDTARTISVDAFRVLCDADSNGLIVLAAGYASPVYGSDTFSITSASVTEDDYVLDINYTISTSPVPDPTPTPEPEPEPEEAALIVEYVGTIYDAAGNVVSQNALLTKRYVVHVDDVINGADYIRDFTADGYQYVDGDESTFTVEGKATISFNYSKQADELEEIEEESTPLAPIEDESTPLASAIPNTGDSSNMIHIILLALVSVAGAVGVVIKKKSRKSN